MNTHGVLALFDLSPYIFWEEEAGESPPMKITPWRYCKQLLTKASESSFCETNAPQALEIEG